MDEADNDNLRQARLDAIALVRFILEDRTDDARALIAMTVDLQETARACAGFAASVLMLMPADRRARILDGLLEAAVGPDGGQP